MVKAFPPFLFRFVPACSVPLFQCWNKIGSNRNPDKSNIIKL